MGLLFGVGFVMGGWCPGTALVGLASARWDALVFLVGAGLGSILFNELFPLIRPLQEGGHAGLLFLPDTLSVSWRVFPLLFCLVAVGAFAGSTWMERKFGKDADKETRPDGRNRTAAIVLLLAAAGLIFVTPATGPVREDVSAAAPGLLGEVAAAADHIEPEELADHLMAGGDGLTVIDLRSPEAYRAFHIRDAINIPLAELSGRAGSLAGRRVVLYSNGTTHAAQAWLMMRQWGWSDVRVQ